MIANIIFVLHCYVSDKRKLCFVFHCNDSDKRILYLYFIGMLLIQHAVFVVDCYVSDKRTLKLYVIGTFAISARCVLYLIVTLVRSAHYIFTSLLP